MRNPYSSKKAQAIDLMAAYVIPLFYAFKHHEKLLKKFLDEHPDQKRVVMYIQGCFYLKIYLEQRDKSSEELSTSEELNTFLKQIDFYCMNFITGYKLLQDYFRSRKDIVALLLQNEEVIKLIAIDWVNHIIKEKLPIINNPVPSYLCPFDTSKEDFKTVITYKTETRSEEGKRIKKRWEIKLSYLEEHLKPIQKRGLPKLESLIKQIQQNHFNVTLPDQTQINEACSFNPNPTT